MKNSRELIQEIKTQLEALKHKKYEHRSFKSGYLIGYFKSSKKYTYEDMLDAAKYGYDFHKTTSFPEQEFEDSCIRNTQQWLTLKD